MLYQQFCSYASKFWSLNLFSWTWSKNLEVYNLHNTFFLLQMESLIHKQEKTSLRSFTATALLGLVWTVAYSG